MRDIVEQDQEKEEEGAKIRGEIESIRRFEEIKLRIVRGKHHTSVKTAEKCLDLPERWAVTELSALYEAEARTGASNDKIFEYPFCYKVFGLGQALGGHKRSHLMASSSTSVDYFAKLKQSFIDLNSPTPAEEDELIMVKGKNTGEVVQHDQLTVKLYVRYPF